MAQAALSRLASLRETRPNRRSKRESWNVSKRMSRTTDGKRRPDSGQSASVTSVAERAPTDVTAATMASGPSLGRRCSVHKRSSLQAPPGPCLVARVRRVQTSSYRPSSSGAYPARNAEWSRKNSPRTRVWARGSEPMSPPRMQATTSGGSESGSSASSSISNRIVRADDFTAPV